MAGKYGKDVLFCQQNNKFWVAVLGVTAAAVLGLAVFLAFEEGKFKGWGHGSLHASKADQANGDGAHPFYVPHGPNAPAQAGMAPLASAPAMRPAPITPIAPAPMVMAPVRSNPMTPTAMTAPAPMRVPPPANNVGAAQHLQTSFNTVAETIRPAVVNINAIRNGPGPVQAATTAPQFVNPFDGVPDKMIGALAFESVGSGVIIDARGYVITNAHVVEGATAIMITRFHDPVPIPARIVSLAPHRDLALLKLGPAGPYPSAELANSDQVTVGDWVMAVGNPFGLGHTVTAGIISGRRSSINIAGVAYTGLLQTDAPINQGSSGGPLVNLQAKIVGINTAIYAPTGVFNGTGFAIPSNQVGAFIAMAMPPQPVRQARTLAPAMPQAPQAGALRQPAMQPMQPAAPPRSPAWIGVNGIDITPAMARKLALARPEGVFVNTVVRNSPADNAEIRAGDVITEMAGRPVRNRASLQAIAAALPPGLKVPVVIVRAGRTKTKRLKLGMNPNR